MYRRMDEFNIRIIGTGIIFIGMISIGIQCNKIPNEPPMLQYSGFKTRCLFVENFDGISPQWQMEGSGIAHVTTDSGLAIQPTTDSLGVIIWLDKNFEGDYLLEYQLVLPDTLGMHLLFIATAGLQGEDIFMTERNPTGAYETYTNGNLKNYQVSMHSYDLQGQHHPHSRLRKNPGNILLSHIPEDPCQANRQYTIDFIKIGNRLQLYVDGKRYHDFRDKGDRRSRYNQGKIGFWFNGIAGHFAANLQNIRIYKLIPN